MEDILKSARRATPWRSKPSAGNRTFSPSAIVWMAMRGEHQAEHARGDVEAGRAHARADPVRDRSTSQTSTQTQRDARDERRVCAAPPVCAAMMVVLIAPGPASSGTASGTTPDISRFQLLPPPRASGASRRPWRSAWRAPSAAAPGRRRPGTPAGSRPRASSALAEQRRAGEHQEHGQRHHLDQAPPARAIVARAVTLMKIGMARNGSSTAVSVTTKRRYS